MNRTPARIALPLVIVLLASALAGCKLPYKILSKLVGPKPTPTAAPTPTPLPAPVIPAEFSQINDDRVRGEGDTAKASVQVDLPGTKRGEVAATRVFVKKVVDDLGNDLLPEKPGEASWETVYFDPGEEREKLPVTVTVPMKNAPRKAKMLKEVTADVELYMPSRDPASLVTVPSFLGAAGTPVVSPALKEAGVEVTILSPAQIEAEKKAYGEKQRADAKKMGLGGEMLETTVRLAVESYLGSSWINVYLKVSDPNGRIHEFVYLNPAGEPQGVNRSTESGFVGLGSQGGDPGPDWGLQIRLKTPKTFERGTFTLKDIALP
jgi:hypothetical protein